MRLLVCGGRDFSDADLLHRCIKETSTLCNFDPYSCEELTIIHGGASGADALAGVYAKRNGIPCEVYPANWKKYGRAAGPIRNKQMIEEGKPDYVLALYGGTGTLNMVKQAISAGIPYRHIIGVRETN